MKKNLAKVYYRKMDDGNYIIEDLTGFKNYDEIEEQYGKGVVFLYRKKPLRMNRCSETDEVTIKVIGSTLRYSQFQYHIRKGLVFNKQSFTEIIDDLKKAGAYLVLSIRESKNVKKNPVKVIEI